MPYKNAEDQRAYARQHYLDNKELYKERTNKSRPILKAKGRQFLKEYLSTHPCVDCGNDDIRVLQFDHRDLDSSNSPVGRLVGSIGLLKKEVEKCDVRCANCHMIRTADQFGWTRNLEI